MAEKKEYTCRQIEEMLWNVYKNVYVKRNQASRRYQARIFGKSENEQNDTLNLYAVGNVIQRFFKNIKDKPQGKKDVIMQMAEDLHKDSYTEPNTLSDRKKAGETRYALEKLARFYNKCHLAQNIMCIQKGGNKHIKSAQRCALVLAR